MDGTERWHKFQEMNVQLAKVTARRLQRHEQVYHSEFMDGEGKKTPECLLKGDWMFDERVAGVRQGRVADILLNLRCENMGREIEGKLGD